MARAAMVRVLVFIVLWWVLTEGDLRSWYIGGVAVIAATLASLALQPASGWRLGGLVQFVPFFAWQSVWGGIDVARRAFDPRLPLAPVFLEVPLRLPEGPARIFLVNAMSLLPGSLSVEIQQDSLRLHVLDQGMPVPETLRSLEERVAGLFGVELPSPPCPPLPPEGEGDGSGANRATPHGTRMSAKRLPSPAHRERGRG